MNRIWKRVHPEGETDDISFLNVSKTTCFTAGRWRVDTVSGAYQRAKGMAEDASQAAKETVMTASNANPVQGSLPAPLSPGHLPWLSASLSASQNRKAFTTLRQ